jgi:transposase-like protein
MTRISSNNRDITPARRGQIVQQVIVDGWSPTQAAALYGIEERHVARWVDAYRRYGMASLREDTAAMGPGRRWRSRLRALVARITAALYPHPNAPSSRCVVLRGGGDRQPRPDQARRTLWN